MSLESTYDVSDDEDLAIDYSNSLMAFRRLYTTNKERFEKLNWIGVDRKIIDKLFPVDVKYGKNPHPSAYLVSAAKAREWRRLSNIDQVNKNKELKEQEEKKEREQQRAANRERRASRRRGDDLLRTPPKQVTTKKKPRRGQNTPVSASGIQEEGDDESGVGRQLTYDNPPPIGRHDTTIEMEEGVAEVEIYSTVCRGISKAIIDASNIKDKDKVSAGFAHTVGNVHRWLGTYLSNHNAEWPYGQHIAGYLMNPNAKHDELYTWMCMRTVEEGGEDVVGEIVRFSFAHKQCTGEAVSGTRLCPECKKNQYNFYAMCRNEVDKREEAKKEPMLPGRNDYRKYNTPTIMLPFIDELTKQIRVLRTKLWNAEKAIDSLYKQKDIEATNVDHDFLFDEKELRETYSKFQQEIEVTERQMMDILFKECLAVRKRMRERGNAKGHIYTPLMIRFAIMLRKKLSQSNYDFIRQVFGLPTNCKLRGIR